MIRSLLLVFVFVVAGARADAGAFQVKTMRDPLSAREVERGLVLGKGWLEFGLGMDYKLATGAWDSEGEPTVWDSAEWMYSTQRLDMRYGIARRAELSWQLKMHNVRLSNPVLGTDISDRGVGDPVIGYKYELIRTMAPVSSVIMYGNYKAPLANESPGNQVGGPTTFSAVIMTTGTADITGGVAAKRQFGPLALTADLAYVRRMSGAVMYVIETQFHNYNGRIKPGDIRRFRGDVLLQLGPLAFNGANVIQIRDVTRLGSTSPGWFPAANLDPVVDSDGWTWDAIGSVIFNFSRGVDFIGAVGVPMRGEDLDFFPIEDIHPTRGTTYSGTLEIRY